MTDERRLTEQELGTLAREVRAYIEGRRVSPQVAMSMAIKFETVLTALRRERKEREGCPYECPSGQHIAASVVAIAEALNCRAEKAEAERDKLRLVEGCARRASGAETGSEDWDSLDRAIASVEKWREENA